MTSLWSGDEFNRNGIPFLTVRLFAEFTVRIPYIIRVTCPFLSQPFELFENRFDVVVMTTCHDAFIDHNINLESYLPWMSSHLGPSLDMLCTGGVFDFANTVFSNSVRHDWLLFVRDWRSKKPVKRWSFKRQTIRNGFSFASEQFYRLYRSA